MIEEIEFQTRDIVFKRMIFIFALWPKICVNEGSAFDETWDSKLLTKFLKTKNYHTLCTNKTFNTDLIVLSVLNISNGCSYIALSYRSSARSNHPLSTYKRLRN